MTQTIDRETAIALAKEAGMAGMLTDVVCSLEEIHRLCNLAVAHSRKDAEPVAWIYIEKQGRVLSFTPPTSFDKQELSEGEIGIEALYLHPPEADKLLQQALDALEDESLVKINNSIAAIRTYLEGSEMTEQLKALAEAAKGWKFDHIQQCDDEPIEVGQMSDGEFYQIATIDCEQYGESSRPLAEYLVQASPERILALIAENERLTQANLDLTTTLRLATKRRSEPDSGMEIMKL